MLDESGDDHVGKTTLVLKILLGNNFIMLKDEAVGTDYNDEKVKNNEAIPQMEHVELTSFPTMHVDSASQVNRK